MRRSLAALLSLILFSTFLLSGVAAAEENIDQWAPEQQYNSPNWPGPGYMGFGASYSGNYLTPNYLLALGNKAINTCESMSDPKCTDPDVYQITTGLTLPTCTTIILINCLNKFEATKRDGTKLEIKNLGEFKSFNEFNFSGSEETGLPNPGSPTIYQIPDAPHPGGDKYMVIPYYQNMLTTTESNRNLRNFNYNVAALQLRIMIFAISIYKGKYEKKILDDTPSKYSLMSSSQLQLKNWNECLFNNATECIVARAIPDNIKFSIGLKTSFSTTNQIFGRVSEVEIFTGRDKQGNYLLELSGYAQKVPMFGKWVKKSELPKELTDFYAKRLGKLNGWGASKEEQLLPADQWSLFRYSGDTWVDGLEEIQAWLKVVDKASLTPSSWSMEFRMQQGTGSLASFGPGRCYYPDASLIVTTNATDFLSTSPTFDEKSQEIVYTVAAPHYLPNGEVFKGSYELIIRSDTARCLYNFSSAPLKASIQVTSADNTEQIAVTNMVEKNGWVYLTAKGFTFSTPKLRVSLSQDQILQPSVSSQTPDVAAPKLPVKKSISCVKGKLIRKISGISPKCPKGFKQSK